jgi:hypothetical protein
MRFVIVHYHIFKNAGTTVRSILERLFAERFTTLHGLSSDTVLDGEHLTELLRTSPETMAISSHHLRYPLPESRGVALFDLCFLRHPLDRLQSMYSYLRSARTPGPLGELAMQCSDREFFRALTDHSPHLVSNVQVLQLARAGRFTHPAGAHELRRAIQTMREMAVPGAVELFDESLVSAEYFLQPAFPGIGLDYVIHNSSRTGRSGSRVELEHFRDAWGDRLYQDIMRLNEFDMELYQATCNEVQRRFALVPDAGDRLLEFRSRCNQLKEVTVGA